MTFTPYLMLCLATTMSTRYVWKSEWTEQKLISMKSQLTLLHHRLKLLEMPTWWPLGCRRGMATSTQPRSPTCPWTFSAPWAPSRCGTCQKFRSEYGSAFTQVSSQSPAVFICLVVLKKKPSCDAHVIFWCPNLYFSSLVLSCFFSIQGRVLLESWV